MARNAGSRRLDDLCRSPAQTPRIPGVLFHFLGFYFISPSPSHPYNDIHGSLQTSTSQVRSTWLITCLLTCSSYLQTPCVSKPFLHAIVSNNRRVASPVPSRSLMRSSSPMPIPPCPTFPKTSSQSLAIVSAWFGTPHLVVSYPQSYLYQWGPIHKNGPTFPH